MKFVTNALNLCVAGSIVYWLNYSGRLDLSLLQNTLHFPFLFCVIFMVWGVGIVVLGAVRWGVLLKATHLEIPKKTMFFLATLGNFLNTLMPGSVVGDLAKGLYVWKIYGGSSKKNAALTILLDRFVGLYGLFCIGFLFLLFSGTHYFDIKRFPVMFLTVMGFASLTFIFYMIGWKYSPPKFFNKIRIFHQMIDALQKQTPISILCSVGFAIVIHALNIILYLFATWLIAGDFDVISVVTIIPVGMMATALPLAPGGLGIGHVAFEALYHSIGIPGGANIFNLIFIWQIILGLISGGVVIIMKSRFEIFQEKMKTVENIL